MEFRLRSIRAYKNEASPVFRGHFKKKELASPLPIPSPLPCGHAGEGGREGKKEYLE
jgi:hypothetical protein